MNYSVNLDNLVDSVNLDNLNSLDNLNCLNYPFYLYPRYPFSGYFETEEYIKNLLMLDEEIDNFAKYLLDHQMQILFHITIGACMEEYLLSNSVSPNIYDFQWQQLCPEHLRYHAKNGNKVIHYIISPNASFEQFKFINPMFVSKCDEFEWKVEKNKNKITIYSPIYDFTTYIFCTMMPSNDIDNLKKINILKLNNIVNSEQLIKIKQTNFDKLFIKNFYDKLNNLSNIIKKYNGTFTCFSFAVFNEKNTNNKSYNNFEMFKEITQIEWNNQNMLLGRWFFIEGHYGICKFDQSAKSTKSSQFNQHQMMSYVDRHKIFNDYELLRIDSNGNIYFI